MIALTAPFYVTGSYSVRSFAGLKNLGFFKAWHANTFIGTIRC